MPPFFGVPAAAAGAAAGAAWAAGEAAAAAAGEAAGEAAGAAAAAAAGEADAAAGAAAAGAVGFDASVGFGAAVGGLGGAAADPQACNSPPITSVPVSISPPRRNCRRGTLARVMRGSWLVAIRCSSGPAVTPSIRPDGAIIGSRRQVVNSGRTDGGLDAATRAEHHLSSAPATMGRGRGVPGSRAQPCEESMRLATARWRSRRAPDPDSSPAHGHTRRQTQTPPVGWHIIKNVDSSGCCRSDLVGAPMPCTDWSSDASHRVGAVAQSIGR